MISADQITLNKIETARKTIASTIHPTPLIPSASLSQICNAPIFLKLEHQQLTGSFKLRGATNAILNLNNDQKSKDAAQNVNDRRPHLGLPSWFKK